MYNQRRDNGEITNQIRGFVLEHLECLLNWKSTTSPLSFNSSDTRNFAIHFSQAYCLRCPTHPSPLWIVRLPDWPRNTSERIGTRKSSGPFAKSRTSAGVSGKVSHWHLLLSIFKPNLFFQDKHFPNRSDSRNGDPPTQYTSLRFWKYNFYFMQKAKPLNYSVYLLDKTVFRENSLYVFCWLC